MSEEGARERVAGRRRPLRAPSTRARSHGPRALAAAVIAACAAGLLVPAAAPADSRLVSVQLRANAGNGYRFLFAIEPDGSGRGPAGFGFRKRTEGFDSGVPGFSAAAFYSARHGGSLRGRRLTAAVGAFGVVDARFERSSRKKRVHSYGGGCKEISVRRRGLFVGRIDFAGEGSYAEVHRETIRGRIDSSRFSGCHGRRDDSRASFPVKVPVGVTRAQGNPLLASCGADPETGLVALRDAEGAAVLASSDERFREQGMRIVRYLIASGDRDWFRTGPKLRRATIEPTFPAFSGSARYARGALTGDLRVSLPGLADVPLTLGDAVLGREDDVPIPDCYPFGD